MRRLSNAVLLSIIVLFLLAPAQSIFGQPTTDTASDVLFAFSVGTVQPDNNVLYSVFVLTGKQAVQTLTVSANLPADALAAEVVIAPQSATLTSAADAKSALTWQVDSIDASTVLGPFTYRVSLPAATQDIPAGINGTVTWTAPDAGSIDITPMDGTAKVFAETAAITFDAAGTINDKGESIGFPVDDSGIWLYVPPDAVAGTVTLRFTRLIIDADNIPQDADTWWCALVKIETDTPLTLNKPIIIAVPTRQPLTPGLNVQVLAQSGDGAWQSLPNAQGLTISIDGTMAQIMVTGDLPNLLALGVNSKDRQGSSGPLSPAGGGGFNTLPAGQFGGGFNGGFNSSFNGGGFNSGFNGGAKICNFNFCN